jgi:AcrR family transcriptional regulator
MTDRPRTHDGTKDPEGQIFAATEQLLEQVPVHELSVAQIIDGAGISRATFYFYFSSKYAVIRKLAAKVMNEGYGVLLPFTGTGDEPRREALRSAMEAGWRVWREHRLVLRAVAEHWHEVPELREMWIEVVERFTDGVAAAIDEERAAGHAPPGPDSRQLAAVLLWSTAHSLYVSGTGVDEDLGGESEIFETVLEIWFRAIYADG